MLINAWLVEGKTLPPAAGALQHFMSRWMSSVNGKVQKIDTETSNHGGVGRRSRRFPFPMASVPPGMRAPDPKLSPFSKPVHLMGTHLAALPLITDPAPRRGRARCPFRGGGIHFTDTASQRLGLGLGSGFHLLVSIPGSSADDLACEINAVRCYAEGTDAYIVFSLRQTRVGE